MCSIASECFEQRLQSQKSGAESSEKASLQSYDFLLNPKVRGQVKLKRRQGVSLPEQRSATGRHEENGNQKLTRDEDAAAE